MRVEINPVVVLILHLRIVSTVGELLAKEHLLWKIK